MSLKIRAFKKLSQGTHEWKTCYELMDTKANGEKRHSQFPRTFNRIYELRAALFVAVVNGAIRPSDADHAIKEFSRVTYSGLQSEWDFFKKQYLPPISTHMY